jgi:hypothetical protein
MRFTPVTPVVHPWPRVLANACFYRLKCLLHPNTHDFLYSVGKSIGKCKVQLARCKVLVANTRYPLFGIGSVTCHSLGCSGVTITKPYKYSGFVTPLATGVRRVFGCNFVERAPNAASRRGRPENFCGTYPWLARRCRTLQALIQIVFGYTNGYTIFSENIFPIISIGYIFTSNSL